jgi:hypothetical protein
MAPMKSRGGGPPLAAAISVPSGTLLLQEVHSKRPDTANNQGLCNCRGQAWLRQPCPF